MASEWIKARQTRYGAFLVVYMAVVLGIVGLANWLAARRNTTFDVTANKRFTLSDQTKKITGNLTRDVNIYYFNKSESFDQARNMLDRYKNLSTKIHIQYIDPEKKPDVARAEGVRAFGDIVVDNGEKKETAKALTEEELTGALVRTMKTGLRMVCFVTGSGEHPLDDTTREGYASVKTVLEKNNYKTETVSLIGKPEVPKTCTVIVVSGPKQDYIPEAVAAIKTFVEGGGRALFNLDPVLNLPKDKLGDTPNIEAMLAEWGVTARKDVVLDPRSALGQFSPVVSTYANHPIVSVMRGIDSVFPLARSLDVKAPAEKLFSSSDESVALVDPKLPLKEADMDKGTKGSFVLAAAAKIGKAPTQGLVVVVGSSNWLTNSIFGAPVGNRNLGLNMFNWLTSDEDLISIRPKDPEDRRMRVTGNSMWVLFFTSVIMIPLIVIMSGISAWWKRR